ncbi:pyrimidine reductase family protein [Rhodococcus kunmingensis]|uniref:pyrimidine reductase family protein n=1 Tax=Aldersonia kunmingensis TaxID=408066 RepID=UPI000836E106
MQHIDIATHVTGRRGDNRDLDDAALADLYAYPPDPSEPWIRVNFVASIDGAIAVDGISGRLGTPADHTVFHLLRELADIILVGAGTVRAEDYGGARTDEQLRERRLASGLTAVPPIAVVTLGAALDPESRLFTDTNEPPVILTCAAAPRDRIRALTDAGARVLEIGDDTVTTDGIVGALAELGTLRVLCEGGPSLFGQLIADDAVDELCLTTSPMLVGGLESRVAVSPTAVPREMVRAHVLADDDGTLLTRWVRPRRDV